MLEKALKVGGPAPDWLPNYEAKQKGVGKLCSHDVAHGIYNDEHKYLPFVPNGINSVATQGQDVISYNFTGCVMAAFKEGGVAKVCHVSTGEGQDCKAEWDAVKARSVNIFEFKPSDFIETGGGAFGGCYGLITADLRIYAITVVRPKAGSGMQIAAIEMAHLLR